MSSSIIWKDSHIDLILIANTWFRVCTSNEYIVSFSFSHRNDYMPAKWTIFGWMKILFTVWDTLLRIYTLHAILKEIDFGPK